MTEETRSPEHSRTEAPEDATPCPCGSGKRYDDCCGPLIAGHRKAETAEACLRSRYSAFVRGEVDYILETHHPATRDEVSRESIAEWSREAEWLGLEVLAVDGGGPDDAEGTITFRARYRQKGQLVEHAEHARFERDDGAWRFIDAATPPYRRETRKVGRNDPCPCGSGTKYKRCCG